MVGSMRVNGTGPGGSGLEMFAGLSARAARPGRAYATPFSLLAHAVGLTVLVALQVSRVAPPAPTQDPRYIPIYGAPVALPPLPKGDPGATRTERTRAPEPTAFTAPVESTPVEPIPVDTALAPAEDLSQSTGSPLGAEGGTTDGSEVGKSGGQAGGVPWGVPNGVIDGTGDLPVTNPDRPPRLLQRIQPVYPQDAFVRKIQGVVKLQILIDARGRVARATVIESIPDLDEAARAAVLQWVFAAAVKDGRPVATLAVAPVRFQIY